MFVLDANALIHALKGKGRVRERLLSHSPDELGIPAIVAFELERGTLRAPNSPRRQSDLASLFEHIAILPFDSEAASRAAHVSVALEKAGYKIGPLDTLIAGTALAHGATLVTHNTDEFSRVPGLRTEDWF